MDPCFIYLPDPSAQARSILKRSLPDVKSEFSHSETGFHTKDKEHSLTCYLFIAGGRIFRCILFPRIFVLKLSLKPELVRTTDNSIVGSELSAPNPTFE